jgi:hypothetical protein
MGLRRYIPTYLTRRPPFPLSSRPMIAPAAAVCDTSDRAHRATRCNLWRSVATWHGGLLQPTWRCNIRCSAQVTVQDNANDYAIASSNSSAGGVSGTASEPLRLCTCVRACVRVCALLRAHARPHAYAREIQGTSHPKLSPAAPLGAATPSMRRHRWPRLCLFSIGIGVAPPTSAPGLRSQLQSHRDWAHPCRICSGTGLAPATSAPGLLWFVFGRAVDVQEL